MSFPGFPPSPTKPPTPSEYAVIALALAGLLMLCGAVALIVALRAGLQQDGAVELEHLGLCSIGLGIATGAGYWVVRRILD